MNPLEAIRAKTGAEEIWSQQGNVHRLANVPDVRVLAAMMRDFHARFVTITATELAAADILLEYLWDLDGQLLGFPVHAANNSIESICDLCEAADWIEQEIHEGFAVNFSGHEYQPLLLREGDRAGVNLREEVP